MRIVIEGADNSGKSTLADTLARVLNFQVITSPGPAKSPTEFYSRCVNFLSLDHVIFDRHCIVSEEIYGRVRGHVMTHPDHRNMFDHQSKVTIYCRSTDATLGDHIVKPHDTPEHLSLISAKQHAIQRLYDKWALENANILYRKGETPLRILRFIMGELNK